MTRIFTCGDIHGCYDELMRELTAVGFSTQRDHLYALGDLCDRGPDSVKVVRLLNEPWFSSIMGNHEQMMIDAHMGVGSSFHINNGGGWFAQLTVDERDELCGLVHDLPTTLTLTTPRGKRIGLVHADLVGNDWDAFLRFVETPYCTEHALWSRQRYRIAREHYIPRIENIDHVYFGHTPIKYPLTNANMSWIDTKCFSTGVLTLVELL